MAQIHIDGFDDYATADIGKHYSSSGVNGSLTITTGGRNSTNCIQLTFLGTSTGYIAKSLPTGAKGQIVVGFAYKTSAGSGSGIYGTVFQFINNGKPGWQLGLAAGNFLQLRSPSSSTIFATGTYVASGDCTSWGALSTSTYYYIEIKFKWSTSIAANDVQVWINGTLAATLATSTNTSNTQDSNSLTVDTVAIGGGNGNSTSVVVNIDDLYIADNTGSFNNTQYGDTKILTISPNAAGTYTTWTPDTGSNYARVNEATEDGDTSYVATNTVGNKDTYRYGSLSGSPATIYGMQINMVARKDDAGGRAISSQIRTGSTDYTGSQVNNLGDSYNYYVETWQNNPQTTVAWTATDINNIEAGCKLVA